MFDILQKLKPNVIIKGNLFPEFIQIISVTPFNGTVKLVGKGESNQF